MAAPVTLSDAAMNFVRDPDGRVRVEDYVSALAAATGEGVLLDAGDFKLADVSGASGSRLIPGQMVLSTRVNELLIGDEAEWDAVPAGAALAVLRRHLDRLGYPIDRLAAPGELFRRHIAASGRPEDWGWVPLSVSRDHWPRQRPLQAAYTLRPVVDGLCAAAGAAASSRGPIGVAALATAMEQVRAAIDPAVVQTLAFETVVGMAKTVPMSEAAMRAAMKEQRR